MARRLPDFTSAQAARVRDDLAQLHRRHRAAELPRSEPMLQGMLHNATTLAQREAAVRRLRGWQSDLQELANGR